MPDQDRKIEIHEVILSDEVDEVSPPPPGLTSNFKNIQEWLFNVCDLKTPETAITTYDFGLFESSDNYYTVFVVGLNKYGEEDHSVIRIDFEPSDMYFQLPKAEYENSDHEQVMNEIKIQLKDFTTTEKFKTSFFAQAKSITVNSKDKIWSGE